MTMAVFGAIAVVLLFITFATTRERVRPPEGQNTSFREDLKDLSRNGPWIVLFISAIFFLIHNAIRNASVPYYFDYVNGHGSTNIRTRASYASLRCSITSGQFDLAAKPHFILKDLQSEPDFGPDAGNIFVLGENTRVLAARGKSPTITTKDFGRGRTVYLSGHKYTPENVRLLHRAIFFAAQAEDQFGMWLPSDVRTEAAHYPAHAKLAVVNSSPEPRETDVRTPDDAGIHVELEAYGSKIVEV